MNNCCMAFRKISGLLLAVLLTSLLAGTVIADALTQAMEQAPVLEVEMVTVPIRDVRGGNLTRVPNTQTDSWNLLIHYYETYTRNHTLVMINLATGEVNQRHFDRGQFPRQMVIAPNGKAYGNTGRGVMIYDPIANDVSFIENSGVSGESKPLVLAPDGMIYGAGSQLRQATAYRIDPTTDTFTSFGRVGPSHEPNNCWGYFVAADRRHRPPLDVT
jgi:hypothetical protein